MSENEGTKILPREEDASTPVEEFVPPPPYEGIPEEPQPEQPPPEQQPQEEQELFEAPATPLPPIALNVGLIGAAGCGLNSVEARIQHDTFPAKDLLADALDSAAENSTFNVEVDGQMYTVETTQITELGAMQIETAKSTEFVQVEHESQTTSLDCIVVCYGIDSTDGFARAQAVLEELLGRGIPAVLAATKSDLDVDDYINNATSNEGAAVADTEDGVMVGTVHRRRVVTAAAGAALARIHGIPFVETSALADSNIQQLFANLVVPRAAAAAAKRQKESAGGTMASRASACTDRRFPPSPYAAVNAAVNAADGNGDGDANDAADTAVAPDAGTDATATTPPATLSIEAAMAPTMWQAEVSGLPTGIGHLLEGAKAFIAEVEAVGPGMLSAKDPNCVGAEIAAANTGSVMAEFDKATFDPENIKFKSPAALRDLVNKGNTSTAKVAAVKSTLDAVLVQDVSNVIDSMAHKVTDLAQSSFSGPLKPGQVVAFWSRKQSAPKKGHFMMMDDHFVLRANEEAVKETEAAGWIAVDWRKSERFTVVDAGDGKIALHNAHHNRFARITHDGEVDGLGGDCDVDKLPPADQWGSERFTAVNTEGGTVALHSSWCLPQKLFMRRQGGKRFHVLILPSEPKKKTVDGVGKVWRQSTDVLATHVGTLIKLMSTSSANAAVPFSAVEDDAMSTDNLVAPELELIAKNANDYLVEDDEVASSDSKHLDIADSKSAITEMSRLTNVEGATRQNRMAARKMANSVKKGLEAAIAVNQSQESTSAANLARAEASKVAVEFAREAAASRVGAANDAICAHENLLGADKEHVVEAIASIRREHIKDRATLFAAETTFQKNDMSSEETLLQLFVGGSGKMPGGAKALFAKALALAAKQAEEANMLTEKQAEHDTRSGSIQAHTVKLEAYKLDAATYALQCAQTKLVLEQLYNTWQEVAGLLDSGYSDRIGSYASRVAKLRRERYELATLWITNFVVEFILPARKRKLEYQLDHSRQTLRIERFVEFADPEDPDSDAVYQQQEDALNAKTAAIGNCEHRLLELTAIRIRFLAECNYAELAAELGEEDVTAAEDAAADAELQRMRRVLDPKLATPMALGDGNDESIVIAA